jgi:hypothetical protein
MKTIKSLIALVTCVIFTSALMGCATTYHRGDGIIMAEKKLQDNDHKPHDNTQNGAIAGGTVGVVTGGVGGGLAGLALGSLLTIGSYSLPLIAATTLGGAAIGALVVGVAGSAAGAGVGYTIDATTPDAGMYEFIVKSATEKKLLTITQYSKPIPLHTEVLILEKNNLVFIKQK